MKILCKQLDNCVQFSDVSTRCSGNPHGSSEVKSHNDGNIIVAFTPVHALITLSS